MNTKTKPGQMSLNEIDLTQKQNKKPKDRKIWTLIYTLPHMHPKVAAIAVLTSEHTKRA